MSLSCIVTKSNAMQYGAGAKDEQDQQQEQAMKAEIGTGKGYEEPAQLYL